MSCTSFPFSLLGTSLTIVPASPRRLSANFYMVTGLFLFSGFLLYAGNEAPVWVFVFVFSGWVVSLCLHEGAHALAAYYGGDRSVLDKGYLRLDPLGYADPLYSFALPLVFLLIGGIGLPGGSVYIQRSVLKTKHWDAIVSAAGPFANLVILLVLGLPFMAGLPETTSTDTFWAAMSFLAALQATAIVLNMLPIPGLDGFGIIRSYLPYDMQAQAQQLGSMLSFALMFIFLSDAVSGAIWNASYKLAGLVSIDPSYAYYGFELFRFWR